MKLNSISIIVPAHNENTRLCSTLDEYIGYFSNLANGSFEIIVVCNCCQDNTPQLAKEYAQKSDKVKVVNFPEKIGKGGAIKEGLKLASGDICLFTDADGSTSACESAKLIRAINEGSDAAIGSRKTYGAKILIKPPLSRRIASWGFYRLVRLLFGLPFRDTQCGAKAFTRDVIGLVLNKVKTNGFSFDLDLLLQLKKNGHYIKEVPIIWEYRECSTLVIHRDVPGMFWQVLKLRFRE